MPFSIVRNDITHMHVDAIVNAANEQLRHGGGVCGAIFSAAGADKLEAACKKIGHCDTGSAVATPGFNLPTRHVIHTVGPIWRGGGHGEEQALRSCYRSSLELAQQLGDNSIAFPLISSGIYGYPKEQAIDVALEEIRIYLDEEEHELDVFLILFDVEAMRAAGERFGPITALVNDVYTQEQAHKRRIDFESAYEDFMPAPQANYAPAASSRGRSKVSVRESLDGLLRNLDASFSQTLLKMIDDRNLKDSDVYKKANISRQHFSKIRNNPNYQPKKATVFALAIALQLSVSDTRLLLERAGFAINHSDVRDIIVEYFIALQKYDIYEINLALYTYDQPLLG